LQVTYPFPWQAAAYAMVDGVLSVLRNLPLLDASGAALGYEVWRNPAQTKLSTGISWRYHWAIMGYSPNMAPGRRFAWRFGVPCVI